MRPWEQNGAKVSWKETAAAGHWNLCRDWAVSRALLTINPLNAHSIQVALANGGVEDSQGVDPVSKEVANRYWIELQD